MNSIVTPRVAGVVVLYNSQLTVIDNIRSYINQIEKLFVVDNSELVNKGLTDTLNNFPTVVYINNGGNEGIAKALNIAAQKAVYEGFDYLLTMDDDTSVPPNMVSIMLSFIEKHPEEFIGIIAPQSTLDLVHDSYKSVFFCITSGNLLSLQAYIKCGSFLDKLFIDWVDHEFCIRIIKNGYSIIQLNYLHIEHRLGIRKNILIGNYKISWVSHAPIRVYYKIRNTIYVLTRNARDIPIKYYLFFTIDFLKEIFKNVFLETSKIKRLSFIIKGVRDSFREALGPYV